MTPEQLKLTEQLKTARGKRFGELLKKTYYAIAPELVADARQIIETTNVFTGKDLLMLSAKFNLCCKHCCEFLEDPVDQVLPCGTYQRMLYRGFKPKKALEKLKQEGAIATPFRSLLPTK